MLHHAVDESYAKVSMRRYLGWFILFLLGAVSCKEEEDPTSFQGEVVYADDNAPFLRGNIQFTAKGTGAGGKVTDFRQFPLDVENGAFEITFEANEDIIGFDIEVSDTVFFERIGPEQGLDCGAIPCEGISPGRNYRDLIIRVPR